MNGVDEGADGPRTPRLRAVALRYEPGSEHAPRVVAKGDGRLAERILAFAREHGVAVREDRDLLELLACDVGEEIPVELYDAVARILTCLYTLNRKLADEGFAPLP
jgi:flagellar biosynthesis protein